MFYSAYSEQSFLGSEHRESRFHLTQQTIIEQRISGVVLGSFPMMVELNQKRDIFHLLFSSKCLCTFLQSHRQGLDMKQRGMVGSRIDFHKALTESHEVRKLVLRSPQQQQT